MSGISEFGFGRFCTAEEYNEIQRRIDREYTVSNHPGSSKTIKHYFEKPGLVVLPGPNDQKLIHHKQFGIVQGGSEVSSLFLLSQRAGWNQTTEDLYYMVSQPATYHILGAYDLKDTLASLGSGVVLDTGSSMAWIGMILVHPELRRQGIGNAITKHCMLAARLVLNKPVVGLDATPMGQSVYHKLGFKPNFRLWRSIMPTSGNISRNKGFSISPTDSVDRYIAFLKRARSELKLPVLEFVRNMYPEGCWVLATENNVEAMIMSRPGRLKPFIGPLVANSQNAAGYLLQHALNYWKQKGHSECFLDIPEIHFLKTSEWRDDFSRDSAPADFRLSGNAEPARVLTRMYEMATESSIHELTQNTLWDKKDDLAAYRTKALDGNRITLEYMKRELEGLEFWYCAAGPEIG